MPTGKCYHHKEKERIRLTAWQREGIRVSGAFAKICVVLNSK